MENQEQILIIGGDSISDFILPQIEKIENSNPQVLRRKNFDGDTASLIITATVVSQAIPYLLGQLKEYAQTKKVTVLKIGDMEIKNPTADIIERFGEVYSTLEKDNSIAIDKEIIKELIGKDRTEKTLKLLFAFASNNDDPELEKTVIVLKARLSNLKKNFILGIMAADELSTKRMTLNLAILELVENYLD